LVIGGTGFIGRRVTRKLVERGERVVAFDIQPDPKAIPPTDSVKLVKGDSTHIHELLAAIVDNGVDGIIHLASFLRGYLLNHPYMASSVNVLGTTNAFEAARLASLKRVVYASSISAMGPQHLYGNRPVNEDDMPYPPNIYGATKWMNELTAERYQALYGMSVVGLRPSLVFGYPGSGTQVWMSSFINNAAVGKPDSTSSKPDAQVPLIYVEDIAEQFVRLCLAEWVNYPIFFSGGDLCSPMELAAIIKEFVPNAQFSFTGDVKFPNAYLIDDSRIRRELGYERPTLKDRIRDHLNEARREAGLPPL